MARNMSDVFDDSACSFSFVSGESSPLGNKDEFFNEEEKETIIFDAIHGNIRVPPICRLLIDTPQFNR